MTTTRESPVLAVSRRTRLWSRWTAWRVAQLHLMDVCPHDGVHLRCLWCQIGYSFEHVLPGGVGVERPGEARS